jgi:molecular chaperone DnaJ
MIKKINTAFEVLSDERKRAQYDKMEFDGLEKMEPKQEPAHTNSKRWKMADERVIADVFDAPHLVDIPRGRFHIIVEPSLCMAFGSCEVLAPKVFVVEKNKMVNPKAKVECETCADYESIHEAFLYWMRPRRPRPSYSTGSRPYKKRRYDICSYCEGG